MSSSLDLLLRLRVPSIVLFLCGGEDDPSLQRAFEQARWPGGYRVQAIDLAADDEVRLWFNLGDRSAVAVVLDGAILALEHACDAGACSRLLRASSKQLRTFDEI